ncbi:transmembrane protein 51a [Amphiprion ocellaris]|uniref:Transmembrane protein 51a n=1 Tax=Amphiprion ocellaris TaxID=80972 RepID=A0AAQ5ZAP8_AMPOC|nr:transmembrane protein 51a [Amphiprion ocellaris]XP_023129657.2 transmembrane protein 51a [Amphiprion ocellaris]XP_023129658.2 transmembrane protein 51a [Amphiprion ocellaris]
MRSTMIGAQSPVVSEGTQSNNNNSNSSSGRENTGNSGSQYALCALGVGLIALGVVMIVWSVVPADAAGNSSLPGGGQGPSDRRNKASSVAFVLTGSGVVMLLLSLCLGMRNKQREMRFHEAQNSRAEAERAQEARETAEEQAQRYAVPTYEEAVGSGQYPVRQSNLRPSTSQLPSYDDLVQVDGVQYENEGPEVTTAGPQPAPASGTPNAPNAPNAPPPPAAASTSNRRPAKNSRKLLPIKIRRIKSEKLHVKNGDNSQPAAGISIEPLTPPPQYDDKVPPI